MRRLKIAMMGLAMIAAALIVFVFLISETSKELFLSISIINAIVLAVVAAFILWKVRKDMKSGVPLKDEMSQRMTHKAGYYSWVVTVILLIMIMFFNIFANELFSFEMGSDILIPLIVMVPGLLFIGLRTFYMKKGFLE